MVRFFISLKKKKVKINLNNTMNPDFFVSEIPCWHRKYNSATRCKGASKAQTSNALCGCENDKIQIDLKKYRLKLRVKLKKSLCQIIRKYYFIICAYS